MVLEDLEGSERSTTGKELVGELCLVVRLVSLLVVVACLVWSLKSAELSVELRRELHTETEHLGCLLWKLKD